MNTLIKNKLKELTNDKKSLYIPFEKDTVSYCYINKDIVLKVIFDDKEISLLNMTLNEYLDENIIKLNKNKKNENNILIFDEHNNIYKKDINKQKEQILLFMNDMLTKTKEEINSIEEYLSYLQTYFKEKNLENKYINFLTNNFKENFPAFLYETSLINNKAKQMKKTFDRKTKFKR